MLITTSGSILPTKPVSGEKYSSEELEKYVSGGFKLSKCSAEYLLVVNENSYDRRNYTMNHVATELFGYYIFGDVLHVKECEVNAAAKNQG
tara:strand:- start:1462 stop:1734 length:273 start_codon:yes stop_codon:yes gene_type:complete